MRLIGRTMTCPAANGACKWGPSPCARPFRVPACRGRIWQIGCAAQDWRRPPGPAMHRGPEARRARLGGCGQGAMGLAVPYPDRGAYKPPRCGHRDRTNRAKGRDRPRASGMDRHGHGSVNYMTEALSVIEAGMYANRRAMKKHTCYGSHVRS